MKITELEYLLSKGFEIVEPIEDSLIEYHNSLWKVSIFYSEKHGLYNYGPSWEKFEILFVNYDLIIFGFGELEDYVKFQKLDKRKKVIDKILGNEF